MRPGLKPCSRASLFCGERMSSAVSGGGFWHRHRPRRGGDSAVDCGSPRAFAPREAPVGCAFAKPGRHNLDITRAVKRSVCLPAATAPSIRKRPRPMGNAASTARFPPTGTPGGALPGRFGHVDDVVIRYKGPGALEPLLGRAVCRIHAGIWMLSRSGCRIAVTGGGCGT
jgi:hypothetical protein